MSSTWHVVERRLCYDDVCGVASRAGRGEGGEMSLTPSSFRDGVLSKCPSPRPPNNEAGLDSEFLPKIWQWSGGWRLC